MSEICYCACKMIEHFSAEPLTFDELKSRMPHADSLHLKQALGKLRRKGLITYLEADEGGPGWVLASRSE